MSNKVEKSEDEWKTQLGEEAFQVCRLGATEPAFTGAYLDNKAAGTYLCASCGAELFSSAAKYDSGTGWPSFSEVPEGSHVAERMDHTHGMTRSEIVCGRCDGHLGHVFPDGPGPSGLRYCTNSLSLQFAPDKGGDG